MEQKNTIEMIPKRLIALLGLLAITILLRPGLYGVDAWYYQNIACGKATPAPHESAWLHALNAVIPCDRQAFDATMICIDAVFLFLLYKTGQTLAPAHAEDIASLFLLNPILLTMLIDFEGSLFGLIPLGLSIYLLTQYLQKNEPKYAIGALATTLIGCLFWLELGIWGILELTTIIAPIGIYAIITMAPRILDSISYTETEHAPIIGLILSAGLLWPTLTKKIHLKLKIPIIASIILAGLSLKYSFFLALTLSLATALILQNEPHYHQKIKEYLTWTPALAIIILFIATPPSADNIRFFQNAAHQANGQYIFNDYSFRHYLTYYDANANTGYNYPDLNNLDANYYIQTIEMPCKKIDQTQWQYTTTVYLYDCQKRN